METLFELFRSNFYWIDLFIGGSAPVVTYVLYKSGRVGRFIWVLFWVGFCIGLTWEVPMQLLNELSQGHAVHSYTRPPPFHFSVIIISHSLWDGGLFLLGVFMVRLVCKKPIFERFQARELIVLIIWGQASELWVELTSTLGEAWAYIPRPWNPSLFKFNGQDITLMPQLIWLAAPIAFYFIALKVRGTAREEEA